MPESDSIHIDHEAAEKEQYIISHIDDAISNGWIVLYFQPVIRTLSGKICSGEALARWIDPKYGMISPGEFVPVLENSGLSYKLARFVIEQTAGYLCEADAMGMYPIPISINLSRKDFDEMDPFAEVERAVEKYQISRNLLCIEITESTVMENPEKIKAYIRRFHEAGYEVWMDDFGSAYSSLNALKDFDFDEIKLDMVFMQNFNDRAKVIVANCINMAKDLGIHTLCEGVETKEQVDFLLEHGCEKIQGFYYSRPRPLAELKDVIDRGGFSYELSVERFLYDRAGLAKLHAELANAVVLCRNDAIIPLEVSQRLRKGAEKAGIFSIELQKPLDMKETDLWQRLKTVVQNSRITGEKEEVSYFLFGHYYVLTAETVADSQADAGFICVVEMRDITRSARGLVLAEADPVAQSIVGIYDCVYRIDLRKRLLEVVVSDFSGEIAGRRFTFDPDSMSAFIYWKDRERFKVWIEPDHLKELLKDRKRKSFSDFFRIERPDGSLVWELFTVLRDAGRDDGEAILCMKPTVYADSRSVERVVNLLAGRNGSEGSDYDPERDHDADLSDTESRTAAVTSEDDPDGDDTRRGALPEWSAYSLWDSLMEQESLIFFCKDRKHRFISASRGFLSYFGMNSFDPARGKTENECPWIIDNHDSNAIEEQVMRTGKSSSFTPGKVVVNGVAHSIISARFPLYHNGEIIGVLGVFADADSLPGPAGDHHPSSPLDAGTGAMNFSSWLTELAAFEDNYSRSDEDYQVGVLIMRNYWKTWHEFGNKTAENMARVAAETIRSYLPKGCMLGRMDKAAFAIVTKVPETDLRASLHQISEKLARTHYIAAYTGMIDTYSAVSSRSETNNLIRTVGLALEKAEKDQKVRDFDNERGSLGTAAAAPLPRDSIITWQEAEDRIAALLHSFDFVRLTDPELQRIIRFDRDGTRRFQRGNCFDVWGTGIPCDNCISLRTLKTRERLTKFETDGKDVFIVQSQYLEVDGRPCVMETVARMNDSSVLGEDERGMFIRALSNCRARNYDDTLTGIHNRRYYKDILAEHKVDAAAFIDIRNLQEIEYTYGHLAGDAAVRAVSRAIASCVRYNDLVRYEGDRFLIVFRGMTRDSLEKKLRDILARIGRIHFDRYPELHVLAAAGGVCRTGLTADLIPDAETALNRADHEKENIPIL